MVRAICHYTFLAILGRPFVCSNSGGLLELLSERWETFAYKAGECSEIIVILIDRPNHDPTESYTVGKVYLLLKGRFVIIADPLVVRCSELNIVDCCRRVVLDLGLLLVDNIHDLEVGERTR